MSRLGVLLGSPEIIHEPVTVFFPVLLRVLEAHSQIHHSILRKSYSLVKPTAPTAVILKMLLCIRGTNTKIYSEFPSLSSNSQSQLQNTNAQALWSNPSIRAPQHNPVQRPQTQSSSSHSQQTPLPASQNQPQGHEESAVNSNSKFVNDDYRFTTPNNLGQNVGASQPQSGDVDDFPPLGGNNTGDLGQERRSGIVQSGAFGASDIASLGQNNNRLTSPGGGLQERALPNITGRNLHTLSGSQYRHVRRKSRLTKNFSAIKSGWHSRIPG